MEKSLVDLIGLVEAEKVKYGEMYALSERKRDTIIEGNAEELEPIMMEEKKLSDEIAELEKQRLKMMKEMADELHIGMDDVNVTTMSELVSPELAQKLKQTQSEFLALLQKQSQINEVNKQLLETQLQYIEFFLESLSSSDKINNTYAFDGTDADEKNQRTGLIDHKI